MEKTRLSISELRDLFKDLDHVNQSFESVIRAYDLFCNTCGLVVPLKRHSELFCGIMQELQPLFQLLKIKLLQKIFLKRNH